MSELRVFFGHHKCASRYFRMQVLGPVVHGLGWSVYAYVVSDPPFHFRRLDELDLCHIDYEAIANSDRDCFLALSNSSDRVLSAVRGTGRRVRGIRVLRDPRQVLVSSYLHHLEGHDEATSGWVWDKLIEDRRILRRLSFSEGLLYEFNNISRELLDTQLFGWVADDDVLEFRLEDYVKDPGDWNARIASHLKLPPSEIGSPTSSSANPESRPWQDCFSDELKMQFKIRYGKELVRLGYESDLNW